MCTCAAWYVRGESIPWGVDIMYSNRIRGLQYKNGRDYLGYELERMHVAVDEKERASEVG